MSQRATPAAASVPPTLQSLRTQFDEYRAHSKRPRYPDQLKFQAVSLLEHYSGSFIQKHLKLAPSVFTRWKKQFLLDGPSTIEHQDWAAEVLFADLGTVTPDNGDVNLPHASNPANAVDDTNASRRAAVSAVAAVSVTLRGSGLPDVNLQGKLDPTRFSALLCQITQALQS